MANLYQRTSQTHTLCCNITQGSETRGMLWALYRIYKKVYTNSSSWHLDAENKSHSMHFTGHVMFTNYIKAFFSCSIHIL